MPRQMSLHIISIIVLFVVSIVVVTALTPNGSSATSDSINYLDIANNIKNGHGVVSTDFSIENLDRENFIENRVWPPLYPALLSLFIKNAADTETVANVSKILLFISLLFTYLILLPFTGQFIALVASLLLCITIPFITIYTFAWSETLFVPLLLISAWASIQYLSGKYQSESAKVLLLLVLTIALVAAAYTRYVGIIFFLLIPFTFFMSERNRSNYVKFTSSTMIYAILTGYLLLGNYLSTGSISGIARAASDQGLLENIDALHKAVSLIFLSFSMTAIVMVSFILLAFYIVYKLPAETDNDETVILARKSAVITLFTGISYLVAIVVLRSRSNFDSLDIRLFTPAFPFFWVLLLILDSFFNVKYKKRLLIRMVFLSFLATIALKGQQQFTQSIETLQKYSQPALLSSQGYLYKNIAKIPETDKLLILLRSHLKNNAVAVVKSPLFFEFVFGIKSVQKPEKVDLAIIQQLNRLPATSLLKIEENERQIFSSLAFEHGINYQIKSIAGFDVIELPVYIP